MNRTTLRRRRTRTNHVATSTVLLRGGIVAALLVAFIALAVSLYSGVPGRHYLKVRATLPVVGNLIQHDPVRVAGVRVGQVQSVGATSDGRAQIALQLAPGTKLPVDTTIVIRANGLLGGRFVQLIPGRSSQELEAGDQIRPASESITFGVPETLDTFDARTRGRLQDMIGGLGTGLAGRSTGVNTLLHRASNEIVHAQQLITTVTAPPGSVSRLLPSARSGLAPLGANRVALTDAFRPTSDALQPLVLERPAVRATLQGAPSALDAANVGLEKGGRLLAAVRSVATAASRTLPVAPRGLRTATALLRESAVPLARTNTLLRGADPTVPSVLKVTKSLDPVLPRLRFATDDLAPMVMAIGAYGCNIVNLGTTFRSMTGSGGNGSGPNGPLKAFRLQAIAPAVGEVTQTSDHSGVLIKDGYPAPCKYLSSVYTTVTKP